MFFAPLRNIVNETTRRQGKIRQLTKGKKRSVSPSLEQLEERSLLSSGFGAAQLAAMNTLVASGEQAANSLVAPVEKTLSSLIVAWQREINTLEGMWRLPELFPAVGSGNGPLSSGASKLTSNVNVSADVAVTRSGFHYNFSTHEFVQTITIVNTSGEDLSGPLDLALTNLSSNATLANARGTDLNGDPYLTVTNRTLAPNQSTSVVLKFTDAGSKAISYETQLWQSITPMPPLSVQITGLPTSLSDPEGTTINLNSQVSSRFPASSYQYQWQVTQAATGQIYASGTSPNFSFTLGDAGNYTVSLKVTTVGTSAAATSVTFTSSEVTPSVSLNGTSSVASGSSATFTATTTDSSVDAPAGFSYSWNFGDGSPVQTATGGSAVAQVSHAYSTPGTYNVTVTASNQDGLSGSASTSVAVTTANAPNEPLLYSPNLQLLGAFRVPNYSDSTDGLGFGGTALAYDPANNGLFIVGKNQAIAEISIPSTIVNSSNLADLTTSTIVQPFRAVLPGLSQGLSGATDGQYIGGLMVNNGQLIGTDYAFYSGAWTQTTSDFTVSSMNLSTATVQGLYPVAGGRGAAGYLTPIPSEWQSVLGYSALTGLADVPIISTVSSGPAALGFNPGDLSYLATAPTTPFVEYPAGSPLGPFSGYVDPLQNGTTKIGGAVFVPGTSTVLFIGSTGTNSAGYGPPGIEGPWSLNGEYAAQVWAYNANDLLAVKQGTLQSWQVQPYDVWNFQFPIQSNWAGNGTHQNVIGGVAFDPSTDRMYVSVLNADMSNPYSPAPLIYVFHVNVPSAPATAAAPTLGKLAATPTNLSSMALTADGSDATTGPLSAGTSVILTAGNAYAIIPGANITSVAFYLDSNNDGVLDSSDQFLGDGTPSTIPNAQHNYTLTMSTAGLTAGTHTLFAQAKDSNGQVSNVVETTLTIA